jgi:hypothetical protein
MELLVAAALCVWWRAGIIGGIAPGLRDHHRRGMSALGQGQIQSMNESRKRITHSKGICASAAFPRLPMTVFCHTG